MYETKYMLFGEETARKSISISYTSLVLPRRCLFVQTQLSAHHAALIITVFLAESKVREQRACPRIDRPNREIYSPTSRTALLQGSRTGATVRVYQDRAHDPRRGSLTAAPMYRLGLKMTLKKPRLFISYPFSPASRTLPNLHLSIQVPHLLRLLLVILLDSASNDTI